jgi:ABC-type enterochelin transport system substrate-binding protein
MKIIFYSLVLTAFIVLPVRADLTIVYSTMVEPASHTEKPQATPTAVAAAATNMTIKVKGDKARIDASSEITAIFDGRTGELINLLNDEKTIVRVSPDKMRAIADMLNQFSSNTATK